MEPQLAVPLNKIEKNCIIIIINKAMENTNNISSLKEALHNGVVEFTYTKINGETRNAKGTLNSGILNEKVVSSGNGKGREPKEGVVVYYDLNSDGFRSFREENFVGIDRICD